MKKKLIEQEAKIQMTPEQLVEVIKKDVKTKLEKYGYDEFHPEYEVKYNPKTKEVDVKPVDLRSSVIFMYMKKDMHVVSANGLNTLMSKAERHKRVEKFMKQVSVWEAQCKKGIGSVYKGKIKGDTVSLDKKKRTGVQPKQTRTPKP